MDINTLVKITSRAWSLKILALIHEGVARRQAPLLNAAKASRTAFTASLMHLIDLGLLERNPGHGHPLRPEFRLTPKGQAFAPIAARIIDVADDQSKHAIVRKSWTVPVLAITETPKRFVDIKSGLPTVTDRALSQSLTLLEKKRWIQRNVDIESRPPRPTYQATNAGGEISHIVSAGKF